MFKRLIEARQYLGFTKQEFADKLSLKIHNIRDMESGKQKISSDFANKVEEIFLINGWWLLTGKGDMLFNNSNKALEEKENNSSNKLIEITYYEDVYASAGPGAYNYDTSPTIMAFDENFLKVHLGLTSFKNIHIITATGDSMEPTITAGEFLFISPIENENGTFKEGGIYIILYDDTLLVKRISKNPITKEVLLVSDNTIYPSMLLKYTDFNNCKIIGRVIGHFNGL